jgi:hypothetical protein
VGHVGRMWVLLGILVICVACLATGAYLKWRLDRADRGRDGEDGVGAVRTRPAPDLPLATTHLPTTQQSAPPAATGNWAPPAATGNWAPPAGPVPGEPAAIRPIPTRDARSPSTAARIRFNNSRPARFGHGAGRPDPVDGARDGWPSRPHRA